MSSSFYTSNTPTGDARLDEWAPNAPNNKVVTASTIANTKQNPAAVPVYTGPPGPRTQEVADADWGINKLSDNKVYPVVEEDLVPGGVPGGVTKGSPAFGSPSSGPSPEQAQAGQAPPPSLPSIGPYVWKYE